MSKVRNDVTKRHDYSGMLEIRHTSFFDKQVILRIKPVRYECEHCNDHTTTTEKYSWLTSVGKITKGLEEYILRCVINSTIQDVSRKERVSYTNPNTNCGMKHKVRKS